MTIKKTILPIFLATSWISFSEFTRNELLFKTLWINHYQKLGMKFPSAPINGVMWGVWALSYVIVIFIIAKRFSFIQTFVLSWFFGFILMWEVIGNMGVLPFTILPYAIPLSLLESFLAVAIIKKFN